MGYLIQNGNTTRNLLFMLVSSTDHITGVIGLGSGPTVTLSKNGGSFAAPSGAVTEVGNGIYKVAANATDAGTNGPLLLHASGMGTDPCDDRFEVVAFNPDDGVRLGLSALPNAAANAANGLPVSVNAGYVQIDHAQSILASPSANTVGEALFISDICGGRINTAQGGTSTTITLDASASSNAAAFIGDDIYLYGGTGGGARGSGQRRTITAYNTSTKVATVNRAWDSTPDNTTRFVTLPCGGIDWARIVNPLASNVFSNSQIGLNPNAIQPGTLAAATRLFMGNLFFVTTASTTPTTAGIWIMGGAQGNLPYYLTSTSSMALWYNGSGWTISASIGTNGSSYWTAPMIAGPWTANGSASGTPDLTSHSTLSTDFSAMTALPTAAQMGTVPSGGTLTTTGNLPTNFGSQSIDSSGRVLLQPTQTGVTIPTVTITGTATNLTNAPTSGDFTTAMKASLNASTPASIAGSVGSVGSTVNANLIQILGSAAGGDPYPIVNSGSYGNAQLLAAIQNVQNNTFIASSIPGMFALPGTGSTTIQLVFTFYDETGAAKNLDSGIPTAVLVNDAGADKSSRLGSWANPATGKYTINYTSTSTDALEGLHWDVSGTINSKMRRLVAYTQLVDTITSTFTAADRTLLTGVSNVSPAFQPSVDSSGRILLQPSQPGVVIQTVTNLTNPVNLTGDLTAAMKASVTAAVPTAIENRVEMDTNSSKLAGAATATALANDSSAILAAVGAPLQASEYVSPPTATAIANETAAVMLVDGIANPLKVNSDHSVNADVDEEGIATLVAAGVASEVDITVQNNIAIPAAIAIASQDPGVIVCLRGDTLRNSMPLMGNLGTRTKLVMTAKASVNDLDDQAVIQIVEGIGLVRLNGSATVSAGLASLTVRDSTSGAVDLEIDASVTAQLAVRDLVWDAQAYLSTGIISPINGIVSVIADVTRAVA